MEYQHVHMFPFTARVFLAPLLAAVTLPVAAQVNLSGGTCVQDFNSLATNGTVAWLDNSTLPGWYASRAAGGVITDYTAGAGGGTATGTVTVSVTPPAPGLNLISLAYTPSPSVVVVTFAAIPNAAYVVELSTNLVEWTEIAPPVTAGFNGLLVFTNKPAPSPAGYYRTRYVGEP